MAYNNNFGGGMPQPANNLWVGNNYSSGYSQMSRNNYPMNTPNAGMMMPPQPEPINNVLQVMGPESAQAYQLAPNSQVILMDSNKPVFYMKKSDSSGYSETKAYEFHEIPLIQNSANTVLQSQNSIPAVTPQPDFVTKSDFDEFKKMIEELVMKSE